MSKTDDPEVANLHKKLSQSLCNLQKGVQFSLQHTPYEIIDIYPYIVQCRNLSDNTRECFTKAELAYHAHFS